MTPIKTTSPLCKRVVLSLCTASTLFLWVPLYVVYLSINDINFNIFDFFVSSSLITLGASIAFFTCASLLCLLRLNWLASLLLYGLLCWASLAGYLLPLVEQAGMVSPQDLVTHSRNLNLVAGGSLLLVLLTFTRLKAATQVFLLILTLTTVGSALPTLWSASASFSRFTALSSSDNVLVLSFDGLASTVAKQVLEEDPELKQQLKDFIFYDNAIATAPATWASIRSEVFGNFNFREDNSASTSPQPMTARANSIDREQAIDSDIVTYGAYSSFNSEPADRITPLTLGSTSFAERSVTALDLYPYIAARIGTALTAKVMDDQIKALVPLESLNAKTRRSLEHKGQGWDALPTLHSDDLMMFMENLHVAGNRRNVRYLHLLHTHFPVDFDEHCTYRSNDLEWLNANQNYRGLLNETHCALRQTAQVIAKLKAIGAYDNTVLVVKSDHGVPVPYMEASPDNYRVNHHPLWGYNRYRPLMMIKARSRENPTLTYDSRLVSLGDLARTLCPPASGQQLCDAVPGLDLLHPDAPGNAAQGRIFIDVVQDEHSDFTPRTHMTIEVARSPDFTAALQATGKVTLTNEASLFAQRKADLARIKAALEAYHQAHGAYPISLEFRGLQSADGKDPAVGVAGLAPAFIDNLPVDPGRSDESHSEYLYASNGSDYKVLAHGPTQSCVYAKEQNPELLDPVRDCWGFGYWTDGARNW